MIPRAFEVVETILPRMIAANPRILILPVDDQAERNVANMKALIDQQMQRASYSLKLEEVAKSGLIYGLGIQKLFWETRYGIRPSLQQRMMADPQTGAIRPMWIEGEPKKERIFDDWTVETLDVKQDILWDPNGFKLEEGSYGSCAYLIHRTRRSTKYVLDRIKQGQWATAAAAQLTEDDIRGLASSNWDSDIRNRAAGFTADRKNNGKHEVLEFHHEDGRVLTVLDKQIPVQIGTTPYRHGQMCFAAARPATAGIPQLAGIGVIEPIEQLLRELSTLRSQRRDNAALKLAQVFAVSDGAVDLNDLQFFPGAVIPVHGEPRDFLYPVQVGDIPNSSYNEEDRIVQDMDRVTGISDTVTGADQQGSAATATGVQLVQAAANVRIQRQTQRLETELITREAGQAVALNQQMIVRAEGQTRAVKMPRIPEPGEIGPVFDTVNLTPPELAGRFGINVDGGSTAPKNMPQQIQLAQAMGGDFGQDPNIDQQALTRKKLELYGVAHPDTFMVSQQPPLNPDILDRLKQAGVDPGLIDAAAQQSQRENPPAGVADANQPQPQQGPPDQQQAAA